MTSSPAAVPTDSRSGEEAPPISVPGEASVLIEPDDITVSESFTVVGGGFPVGRQITLAFDGAFFAHVVADSQGRIYFEGPLDPLFCGPPWSEFTAVAAGAVVARADVRLCQ